MTKHAKADSDAGPSADPLLPLPAPAVPLLPQAAGPSNPAVRKSPPLELAAHGDFVDWLAAVGGTLIVTTYNAGKLVALSADRGNLRPSIWRFPRPMGLALADDRLALVARDRIFTFGRRDEGDVARLALTSIHVTGLLDAHDAAWGNRGLYFVNTRFNCLARPSDRVRFLRNWQPRFIAGVLSSDACHLNGLGMRQGRPAMVTAFCESDQPKGWKQEDRFVAGVVVDVRHNAVVQRGLCMPHSPRWHAGRWWLCDSGEGTLCTFDPRRGDRTEIAALPGFTRGLCFVAGAAVAGLSRIRPKHILDAPPVRARWGATFAGVAAVEPTTGRIIGRLEFVRGGSEVYDVAFLPGVAAVEVDLEQPAPEYPARSA